MDGLVLVRKPSGPTSHDCVVRLRRILRTKKTGHFGTLDPFAEGLLLIGVGKATKLFPYFGVSDKTYEGTIRLGRATDTYDRTGNPIGPASDTLPTEAVLRRAMGRFQGEFVQLAPPFSAKKLAGKPLYAYARGGIEVERRPSQVRVDRFVLRTFAPSEFDFEVACSAGTYIRALAHDLGAALGCGAHLSRLVRTSCGKYRLENARTMEEIEAAADDGRIDFFLSPLESLLDHLPKVELTAPGRLMVKDGRSIEFSGSALVSPPDPMPAPGDIIRLFDPEKRLIALARVRESEGAPFLVLI
ncbi:MAG: tRNA pseudouridine(55) synthase TruB [Candidatus Aminicenantes bacterium]|nr:tRNA pseudouridine(55) synthase TruB [Candidatus Aminicenantes bacterium]